MDGNKEGSLSGCLLCVGDILSDLFHHIFHFNGGAPISHFTPRILTNVNFDQMAWDKQNHLYALSCASNELYVFNVTPTSFRQVAGSPYKVANAYGIQGLIVVPK